MLQKTKISIVTASYNYQDLIVETIESVISQTYKNWELIIIDDGSSDNSIEVIKGYTEKHDNIFLFQHENEANKGLKETIKLGIEKSSGDYIAFLESDDYWSDDCLEKRIEIINKHPEVGFIFNAVELFGDKNSISTLDKYFKEQKIFFNNINWPQDISLYFSVLNIVPTFSCAMFKKDVFEKVNFDTPYDPWIDWWLYAQISSITKQYFIDEKLTYWRRHPQGYSINTTEKQERKKASNSFRKILVKKQKKHLNSYTNKIFVTILLSLSLEKIFRGLIKKLLICFFDYKNT